MLKGAGAKAEFAIEKVFAASGIGMTREKRRASSLPPLDVTKG
jgi:hypothetical protein